jgi:hypothetical protein
MTDEELWKALARAAREEDETDARLRGLASGELTAEERAELEALARGDDEAAADAFELYRPFEAAEIDRIVASVQGAARGAAGAPATSARESGSRAAGSRAAGSRAAGSRAAGSGEPAAQSVYSARMAVRPARRTARTVAIFAAPLAAAAALVLLMRTRQVDLPAYDLEIASSVQDTRAGGPSEHVSEARLDRTAAFEMVVRPAERARTPIAARAALVHEQRAVAWDAPIEISPEGAVRVRGAARALFGDARGVYEIVVVVARPEDLPSADEVASIASGASSPGRARVVRGRVTFLE